MTNSTVTPLVQPGAFSDLLTEVLRSEAQRLLAHAVEAEVAGFIDSHAGERLDDGRAWIVRHGHLPARDIQTGIGAVRVQQPRVRDMNHPLINSLGFEPNLPASKCNMLGAGVLSATLLINLFTNHY